MTLLPGVASSWLVHRAVDQAVEAAAEAYGAFECNICFDIATEPVVTLCGHMYCWPCLYRWLAPPLGRTHCPVCKGLVDATKVIPLYGRRDQPPAMPVPAAPTVPNEYYLDVMHMASESRSTLPKCFQTVSRCVALSSACAARMRWH